MDEDVADVQLRLGGLGLKFGICLVLAGEAFVEREHGLQQLAMALLGGRPLRTPRPLASAVLWAAVLRAATVLRTSLVVGLPRMPRRRTSAARATAAHHVAWAVVGRDDGRKNLFQRPQRKL